ncbi:HlyD family efflux transporter periplasmic adaptor subunit [Candidatus Synechococcus calcipolaris G9]|uniref:HlyD family efflux transporter periplasmic adaptor subunit n=1 Tax=Candidatus Synechococcus calcipolaris G9 TaxID=1497997 RepID=A0ABT6F016_9SYNE|nr:HlyD family efflux transporter periplasmic adaptor subunit [Candidatus Synechococcus calcipolaris]MDG2991203.1 HlyD family efflux transporter periplasmic adaptor subunit [Candidatus Synechococcus calcipolaris G9]
MIASSSLSPAESLTTTKPKDAKLRRQAFRWVRVGLGLSLIGLAIYTLWWQRRNVVSRVGYINATVINLYAPIPGTLTLMDLQPGLGVMEGQTIGQIENIRNPELETDRQNLENRLSLARTQRQGIARKIASRENQQSVLLAQANSQLALEVRYHQEAANRTLKELRQAQENLAFAEIDAERYASLVESGAVSRQLAEGAASKAKEAQEFVASKQAELQQQQTALAASREGLQLSSARTFSFPDIRLLDLQTEIIDLELELQEAEVLIKELELEIENIDAQIALQQYAPINIPVMSVIWSIANKSGPLGIALAAGDPIVKVIDCQDSWVSALVSERDSSRLEMGQPTSIRLLDGSNRSFSGQVRSIRGGPGKVVAGEDVAVPPPDLVRNELEVQVSFNQVPEELTAESFCGVGKSVEVIFE